VQGYTHTQRERERERERQREREIDLSASISTSDKEVPALTLPTVTFYTMQREVLGHTGKA
jgi:hypothetical protein